MIGIEAYLRKLLILSIMGAIIGGVVLIELYSLLTYPVTSYSFKGLPPLPAGESRYEFLKDGQHVGSYIFRVEKVGQFNGESAYFTSSRTSVMYMNSTIELVTTYIFDMRLRPLEYRLNASLGKDRQTITCTFDARGVNATFESKEGRLSRLIDLPADTVLIDNNMLGHWELFFKSFDLVQGRRVRFTAFIPQALDKRTLEIVIDNGSRKITLNKVEYESQVVRGTESSFIFYISGGSIIKFEEPEQGIAMIKIQ